MSRYIADGVEAGTKQRGPTAPVLELFVGGKSRDLDTEEAERLREACDEFIEGRRV